MAVALSGSVASAAGAGGPVAAWPASVGGEVLRTFAPVYMGYGQGRTLTAEEVARRHDVVLAHAFMFAGEVPAMKAVNPDVTVYAYVSAGLTRKKQDHAERWYAHDARGGRVGVPTFDSWVMEPSSGAWRDEVIRLCLAAVAASGYDGCFLDSLGTGPFVAGYSTGVPVDPQTSEPYTPASWIARTGAIVAATRDRLPHVAVNGVANGNRYRQNSRPLIMDATGGTMAEAFLRSAATPATTFPGEAAWRKDVDMLVDAEAAGRGILATTKLWVAGVNSTTVDGWHEFALASFLLGANGLSRFSFSTAKTFDSVSSDHPWHRIAIGAPTGPYRKAGGVYRRDFMGGVSLVNPTAKPVAVDLGPGYVDLQGAPHTATTLRPGSALVLLPA